MKGINRSYASNRKDRPEAFYKKVILVNFAKFLRKHLCRSLFFDKVVGCKPATLLKTLQHSCFRVNFALKKETAAQIISSEFCYFSEQLFNSILVNVYFLSKYENFQTSQNVIVYILWKHIVYKKGSTLNAENSNRAH